MKYPMRSLSKSIFDWLFGHDYFISYRWTDGRKYACKLKELLEQEGFDCFFDSDDFQVGDHWGIIGDRELSKTSRLVLIGSPEVHQSKAVARELTVFGAKKGGIFPIEFGDSLSEALYPNSPVLAQLDRHILRHRASLEALKDEPSKAVMEDLRAGFKAERQSSRRLRWIKRAVAAISILLVAATTLGFIANSERLQAKAARDSAQTALSQAYYRSIGRGGTSPIEEASLWELGALGPENEPVRRQVLDLWVQNDFLPALRNGGEGYHAATGLCRDRRRDHEMAIRLVAAMEQIPDTVRELGYQEFCDRLKTAMPVFAEGLSTKEIAPLAERVIDVLAKTNNPENYAGIVDVLLDNLDAEEAASLAERVFTEIEKSSNLSTLAEMLPPLAYNSSAAMSLAKRLVNVLENLSETDTEHLPTVACSLVALVEKLDPNEPAAPSMIKTSAEWLVKALERLDNGDFSAPAKALAKLAQKLCKSEAGALAGKVIVVLENMKETESNRGSVMSVSLAAHANSVAALAERIDDPVAASSLAGRIVAALEKTKETDHLLRSALAVSLAVFVVKLDEKEASVSSMARRGTEWLVKALEDPEVHGDDLRTALANSLTSLSERIDAKEAAAMAGRAIRLMEKSEMPRSSHYSALAGLLTALVKELDASAAFSLAEAQITALEKTKNDSYSPLSALPDTLAALAKKLDLPKAEDLARRLITIIEDPNIIGHYSLSALVDSFAVLVKKFNAPALTSLAERLIRSLENTSKTKYTPFTALADSLAALAVSPDLREDLSSIFRRGAEKLVDVMKNQEHSISLSKSASSLANLVAKLDVSDPKVSSLIEQAARQLATAMHEPKYVFDTDLSGPMSSLSLLVKQLDIANGARSEILICAVAAHLRILRDKPDVTKDYSFLNLNLCDWASMMPESDSRVLLAQFALQRLHVALQRPQFEPYQLKRQDIVVRKQEFIRKACATLGIAELSNLLKTPFCRGQFQVLVLESLGQKTGRQFDGDVWKFVTAAAKECYSGVDLDGPVKRITLDDVIQEFSKHVPNPDLNPQLPGKQP